MADRKYWNTYWFISFAAGGTFGNAFIESTDQFLNIRKTQEMLEYRNPIGGYHIISYKQISCREYEENTNNQNE